jgi:hypothetical protein
MATLKYLRRRHPLIERSPNTSPKFTKDQIIGGKNSEVSTSTSRMMIKCESTQVVE